MERSHPFGTFETNVINLSFSDSWINDREKTTSLSSSQVVSKQLKAHSHFCIFRMQADSCIYAEKQEFFYHCIDAVYCRKRKLLQQVLISLKVSSQIKRTLTYFVRESIIVRTADLMVTDFNAKFQFMTLVIGEVRRVYTWCTPSVSRWLDFSMFGHLQEWKFA